MYAIDHIACHFGDKSLDAIASQGTDETVAAFTVEDKNFRQKWYKTTRSTLYVAGNFDMDVMYGVVNGVWPPIN